MNNCLFNVGATSKSTTAVQKISAQSRGSRLFMTIRLILSLMIAFGLMMGLTTTAQAARNPSSVTVGAQGGTTPTYGTAGSASYSVSVNNSGSGDTLATVIVAGLPAGATFTPDSVNLNADPFVFDLTINTTAVTPAGTAQPFTVTVARDASHTVSGSGSLTVNQYPLTVSAAGVDKVYDGTTAATVTLSDNRVSGDVLTTSYTSANFVDVNAGTTKTVNVSGISISGTAAGNYTANTTGTTTANITKATATVALGNLNQTFDGTAKSATATTNPAGKTVAFTYNGSSTEPTNVGSYTVVGTISDANYEGSAIDTLIIGKATATITLGSLSQECDGALKSVTATTNPAGLSVVFTYDPTEPSAPGSYAVAGTINDSNYQGSASGTLVITDTTAPILNISTLSNGAVTNNVALNITGVVSDVGGIDSITVNGTTVNQINGAFNTAFLLSDGVNPITVTATDKSNNQTTVTRLITLDLTTPALTVTAPADNSTAVGSFIDVTGTIDTGNTVNVIVNGESHAASISGGTYTATVNLLAGMNTIEIIVTDLVLKKNSMKRTVVSDAQGVTLQVTQPKEDTIVFAGDNLIKGTVADSIGNVSVTMTVEGQNYIPSLINGAFAQVVSLPSTDSTVAVTVTATDGASHTSSVQRNLVLIDRAMLSASVPSPRVQGESVTFTAGVINGSGSYEYQFSIRKRTGSTYAVVQDYSVSDTWTWDTGSVPADPYYVMVYVRNAATKAYVAKGYMSYDIVARPPATGLTLTANLASPQPVGTTITFTAVGQGGSGSYDYQFILKTGNTSAVVQDHSGSNEYVWNTDGLAPGAYSLQVFVRNTGSTVPYEALKSINFSIVASAPATGATLIFTTPSPQVTGTRVFFEAGGSGGSGSYEYKLLVKLGNVWTVVRDYSTLKAIEWNTAGLAAGTYSLQLFVRNAGSNAQFEAIKTARYIILASSPATGATLNFTTPSPQVTGTHVFFEAGGSGGSGSYEYKLLVKLGAVWTSVREYSTVAAIEWDTTGLAAGTYSLQVQVRNVGSPLSYEAFKNYSYIINVQ